MWPLGAIPALDVRQCAVVTCGWIMEDSKVTENVRTLEKTTDRRDPSLGGPHVVVGPTRHRQRMRASAFTSIDATPSFLEAR
jgi:hypothetical protein